LRKEEIEGAIFAAVVAQLNEKEEEKRKVNCCLNSNDVLHVSSSK